MIKKWASKWKELAGQLNMINDVITNTEHNHPNDCEECCSIMLSKWLEETSHPTWKVLISALDKVSIDSETGLYISYCATNLNYI